VELIACIKFSLNRKTERLRTSSHLKVANVKAGLFVNDMQLILLQAFCLEMKLIKMLNFNLMKIKAFFTSVVSNAFDNDSTPEKKH
jgi:hypothetical protein